MAKQKAYITGGSGFLGSAIMTSLLKNNFEVMAARRPQTDLFRCIAFQDQVTWVDTSNDRYKEEVILFKPDIIVHAAWTGVSSKERVDWVPQLKNFDLLGDVLEISKKVNLKKLLILGSQAEYGAIDGRVNENHPVNGTDAYAVCKQASQKIIENFCNQNNIDWYWLRVFSVFGPGEALNWFIPWVITNQLNDTDCDLTLCEQEYDYLFVNDFVAMVVNIVTSVNSSSGIFNICSGQTIALKKIVEQISQSIAGKGKVNYGAIAYRPNQIMEISGDNSKYNATFGKLKQTDLHSALADTITYYKKAI
ncbi:MAG: NAD(P)-dependent oxidoreductase [Mucilaginibacter sp.]|uniref:NAD-dependent epimerase/dehydratase family protein n=1 Tax=Mucilaginibacter sp. TaxID=1882438 RepID=UPI00326332D0